MIDITAIASIQDKINSAMSSSTNISRLAKLEQYAGMTTLSQYWNPDIHKSGTSIDPNAFIYGLVIVDWDKNFRSRNSLITTNDLQIPFQHIEKIPDWKKSAKYQETDDVIGRFEGINTYASSSTQQFSITLIYQAETRLNSDLRTYWSLERIEEIEKKLKSFTYPSYNKGFSAPPKVLLNIGNIFRSMPCIITDVSIPTEAPFDIVTGLTMLKKITIEMKSAYPMWQAISGDQVFVSKVGNSVFAYKELNNDYTMVNTNRSAGGMRNFNG